MKCQLGINKLKTKLIFGVALICMLWFLKLSITIMMLPCEDELLTLEYDCS